MLKNLYLIIGRSGVGKTTIVNELEKRYGFKSVQSYTTRPPRYENEKGHIFLSDTDFNKLELTAYTFFNGYKYGITKKVLDESDLYIIDLFGAYNLRLNYGGRKLIYINIKASNVIERMQNRGDQYNQIEKRLQNDNEMFKDEELFPFDFTLVNDNLEESIKTLYKYIEEKENE